jgi:hypothetical protein
LRLNPVESQSGRPRSLGSRLVGRDGFGGRIGDHDRTAQGDLPQFATLPLAQGLRLVESLCRTLLVDLGEARQGQQKQRENSSIHGPTSSSSAYTINNAIECRDKKRKEVYAGQG